MHLELKTHHDTPERREALARALSALIEGRILPDVPYKPNEHDDFFWTLDSGNDWKLKFNEQNTSRFEVYYRYHGRMEEVFVQWLTKRLKATPIGALGLGFEEDLGDTYRTKDGRLFVLRTTDDGSPCWALSAPTPA